MKAGIWLLFQEVFYKDGLPDKIGSFINAVSDFLLQDVLAKCSGRICLARRKGGYVFCTVAIKVQMNSSITE